MTPEERVAQLLKIYNEDGREAWSEALDELVSTNPAEFLEMIVVICDLEHEVEGRDELRAAVTASLRGEVDRHLTKDGFAWANEALRFLRENGMDEEADRFESYCLPPRH